MTVTMLEPPFVIVVGEPQLWREISVSPDLSTTPTPISSLDNAIKDIEHASLIVVSDFADRGAVSLSGISYALTCQIVLLATRRDPPDTLLPNVVVKRSITLDEIKEIVGISLPHAEPVQISQEITNNDGVENVGVTSNDDTVLSTEDVKDVTDVNEVPVTPSFPPPDVSTLLDEMTIKQPVVDGTTTTTSDFPVGHVGEPILDNVTQMHDGAISPGISALRVDHASTNCTTIMSWSSKGGVGKTTIASNLAGAVASMSNYRVCIIDLDVEDGNIGSRIGVFRPTILDILQLGEITPQTLLPLIAHDEISGVYAVLAPPKAQGAANDILLSAGNYDRVFRVLHTMFDVIILDSPIGLKAQLTSSFALPRADILIAVIDTERAAVLGMHNQLKTIFTDYHFPREHAGIVINQQIGRKDAIPRDEMLGILENLPVLAEIDDDRDSFTGAANKGSLLVNRVGPEGDRLRQQFASLLRSCLPNIELDTHRIEGQSVGTTLTKSFSFLSKLRSR